MRLDSQTSQMTLEASFKKVQAGHSFVPVISPKSSRSLTFVPLRLSLGSSPFSAKTSSFSNIG